MVLKANFRIYFSIVIFLHVNFFLFFNYKRPTQIKTSFVLILYLWYCCYVIKSKYPVCWSCICDIVVMLSNQNILCVDLVSVILLLCYQIKISCVLILYLWYCCYVIKSKYHVCWSCICDIVVMLSNQNIICVHLVSVIFLLCFMNKIYKCSFYADHQI